MIKLTKITRIHWPSINTMEIQFLIRWIFHDVGITKKSKFGLSLPYEIFRQEFDNYVVCTTFHPIL